VLLTFAIPFIKVDNKFAGFVLFKEFMIIALAMLAMLVTPAAIGASMGARTYILFGILPLAIGANKLLEIFARFENNVSNWFKLLPAGLSRDLNKFVDASTIAETDCVIGANK